MLPAKSNPPGGGRMKRKNLIIAVVMLIAVSAACVFPFTIQTVDNQVATYAAQTVQAWQIQNAATQTQQATWTPQATLMPLPTQTPYPTYTPAVTSTPKTPPTATPTALQPGCLRQRNCAR